MKVHAYNLSTWVAEAGGMAVPSQPGCIVITPPYPAPVFWEKSVKNKGKITLVLGD